MNNKNDLWQPDDYDNDDDVQCVPIVPYRGTVDCDGGKGSKSRPRGHLQRLEKLRRNMAGRCIVCGERHFGQEEFCRACGGKLVR